MGLFVLGVNHKDCPVSVREKIHFTPTAMETALAEVAAFEEISEILILSTCNRVEFYGHAGRTSEAREKILEYLENKKQIDRKKFLPSLYFHEDTDAIHHLFRVASGLDSLVVGENEILGQVRQAFRMANKAGSLHSMLYRLMEKALKTGKDVRTRTKINEGAVSIPSVAVELAQKIFGRLDGEKVMVLGTGKMSALAIKNLRNSGADVAYVVSRDRDRGEAVAVEFGAQWISIDAWAEPMNEIDILIASTAAPHLLVHQERVLEVMKKRHHKPLFLIDISVPRNIDPRIDTIDDVYLYNIDDLKNVSSANLKFRRREIEAAEKIIHEAVIAFQSWMEQMASRPTLERYESFLNGVLDRELGRLVQESGISENQKEELKQRLRREFLQPPLEKIKEASKNGGVARYLTALHALFNLDERDKSP